MAGQFENPANPDYHYEATAREIFEQMDDALMEWCWARDFGHVHGRGAFCEERRPNAVTVLVGPRVRNGGGQPGPHKVEGIERVSFRRISISQCATRNCGA
jgi:cysteine synthase A